MLLLEQRSSHLLDYSLHVYLLIKLSNIYIAASIVGKKESQLMATESFHLVSITSLTSPSILCGLPFVTPTHSDA